MKFFSYDSECGFEVHDTKEEAIDSANESIYIHREHADDGWCDEVESVCWGEIKGYASEEVVGESKDPNFAYLADYKLKEYEEDK